MVKIIKKEVVIDDSLKKKITTICEFCNTKTKIINGNILKPLKKEKLLEKISKYTK